MGYPNTQLGSPSPSRAPPGGLAREPAEPIRIKTDLQVATSPADPIILSTREMPSKTDGYTSIMMDSTMISPASHRSRIQTPPERDNVYPERDRSTPYASPRYNDSHHLQTLSSSKLSPVQNGFHPNPSSSQNISHYSMTEDNRSKSRGGSLANSMNSSTRAPSTGRSNGHASQEDGRDEMDVIMESVGPGSNPTPLITSLRDELNRLSTNSRSRTSLQHSRES